MYPEGAEANGRRAIGDKEGARVRGQLTSRGIKAGPQIDSAPARCAYPRTQKSRDVRSLGDGDERPTTRRASQLAKPGKLAAGGERRATSAEQGGPEVPRAPSKFGKARLSDRTIRAPVGGRGSSPCWWRRAGRSRFGPADPLCRGRATGRSVRASGRYLWAVSARRSNRRSPRIWIEPMGPLALGLRSSRSRWWCGNPPDRHHRGKGAQRCL